MALVNARAVRLFGGDTFTLQSGLVQFTGNYQAYWIDEDGNDHLSNRSGSTSGASTEDVKLAGGDRVGFCK